MSYTSVKKFLEVNKKTNWQTNNNNNKNTTNWIRDMDQICDHNRLFNTRLTCLAYWHNCQLQPTFSKGWRINQNLWELSSAGLQMREKGAELSKPSFFFSILQKDESLPSSHWVRQEAWGGTK